MSADSTTRVAWRLVRNDPVGYGLCWLQWVGFRLIPVAIGLVLKAALDAIAGGTDASTWWLLAAVAGFEVGRWTLYVSAAVQWHGTYLGWQTVPRVNALSSLATDPGPVSGRLPSSPGEAVTRFRDDAQDVALVLDGWIDLSGGVLAAGLAIAVMGSIDPRAALAVVVPVTASLAIAWALGPRLREWRRTSREATGSVTGFVGDTFGSILAVKSAGAEDAVGRRFRDLNFERARCSRRDQVGTEVVRSLGYGTGEVAVGFLLLLVAASFRDGRLSVGDVALFTSYVPVIADLPKWVGRVASYQRQADVAVDRLARLLPVAGRRGVTAPAPTYLRHGPPVVPCPEARAEPGDALEELRIEGLVVRHPGSGRGVLGVDLVVRRGELVVVTGRVGSGKSTLLRGLLGLVQADAGEIRWNGAAVDDPSTFLVPPRAAYLPQVPRLFSEALSDTVLLGRTTEGLERALWLACLDGDVDDMPERHATLIGARGVRLSGGQAQRAAVARALVARPELLVVDDLSSALDVATEVRLWQRLERDGFTTALMVSDREHVLRRADRVVVLDEGRVVATGPPS